MRAIVSFGVFMGGRVRFIVSGCERYGGNSLLPCTQPTPWQLYHPYLCTRINYYKLHYYCTYFKKTVLDHQNIGLQKMLSP